MRYLPALLVALMALPVAADDGFTLGLADMDFSTEKAVQTPGEVTSMAMESAPAERAETLAFQAALHRQSPKERTEALWNSDLGRVYYQMAAEQSMLGREGLVNGGRMAGLGMATAGIGDNDPNGAIRLALGRHKWAEMNANQKVQASVEVGFIAALLYFMVSNAN